MRGGHVDFFASGPVRALAALVLVLFLPGIAVSMAVGVFTRVPARERLITVTALSLAITALMGLALYGLGIPLGVRSWSYSLAAVTVLGSLYRVIWPLPINIRLRVPALRSLIWVAAIGLVLVATVAITARSVTDAARANDFTQLWALPDHAHPGYEVIGLYNHEGKAERYVVRIGYGARVRRLRTVLVARFSSWSTDISVPVERRKVNVVVSFRGTHGTATAG